MSSLSYTNNDTYDAPNSVTETFGDDSKNIIYIGPYESLRPAGQDYDPKDIVYFNQSTGAIFNFTRDQFQFVTSENAGFLLDASDNTNRATLIGGIFGDVLRGGTGNDRLSGGRGNDQLFGGDGDDLLDGGEGGDAFDGGAGNNTVTYANAETGVQITLDGIYRGGGDDGDGDSFRNVQNVIGSAFDDILAGDRFANTLTGGDGADRLNGAEGDDVLFGGAGDDRLEGEFVPFDDKGAGGNDVLFGGAGNDVLIGAGGEDLLEGGEGADDLFGDLEFAASGSENVDTASYASSRAGVTVDLSRVETDSNGFARGLAQVSGGDANGDRLTGIENLIGSAFVDTLTGDAGDNRLDGGAGGDRLTGGLGNDIYVVDNIRDTVIEQANAGTDTVEASISYTLAANVENLTLTGSANLNGTGNDLDNVLIGNAGRNILTGGDGNDTLDGGGGADRLVGGFGDDTYVIGATGVTVVEQADQGIDTVRALGNYTLSANVENLILTATGNANGTGNGLANTLTGTAGNNVLDGKGGADTMIGGLGNDTYVVDNLGDVIVELAGQGTDAVRASVSYTLCDNVERLELTSVSGISGTGNALANTLIGASGANTLTGLGGRDTLTGGAGRDLFVFAALSDSTVEAGGRDTITDFTQSDTDRIDLRGIDANIGLAGDQAFGFIGAAAFSNVAGQLRYEASGANTLVTGDVDGNGAADFAILLNGQIALTRGDFLL